MIRAYMREDWSKLDRLNRKMPRIAKSATHTCAEAVVAYINASWSPTSPSPRGGPPAKVTGNLERSVHLQDRDVRGRFSSGGETYGTSIRYRAAYAGRLEFGDLERPFLTPAMAAMEGQLGLIFGATMRSGMASEF